ncbi:pseudouridylate synthase 1 homolog [Neocloeon triangulifer]|uniref:pseudouridylate synthase 1 homolog n=1 Tax=Neocloeon triangulifer TaxID=2078957 RepID=UPI00286F8870|nr:pseudouridylate synthase 1 homolog [Neocloeon triangulifer]
METASVKRPLEEAEEEAKRPRVEARVRRKKVALLMGYSGQGYFGMQRNHQMRTIEEQLFKALLKADFASAEECENPQSMFFQRAARTDKNVSAAKQIVSLKLCTDPGVIDTLNSHLPPEIRTFGLRRVTKNFNSKGNCDARTYSYTFPTFALSPVGQENESYRATPELLEKFAQTLKLYEGTKNFHNFTCRKEFVDPSSKRYIISFECLEPFEEEGIEFIECRVKGQSFMMHQIRKMVALAIAVVKGIVEPEIIDKAYGALRLDLPMAPGLGLVLQEVHYDRYNKKFGKDGVHDPLVWEAEEAAVMKFQKDYILPTIIDGEKNGKSMLNWIVTLPLHTFDEKRNVPRNLQQEEEEEGVGDD